MPQLIFDNESAPKTREPIAPGRYLCTIRFVEVTQTRKGDTMWKLRLGVEEGDHAGRSVYDNLVFSAAALPRLKGFCEAVGLPTSGNVDLTPELVRGRSCIVEIVTEEYRDKQGQMRVGNAIAYQGYWPVPRPAEGPTSDDHDLPF
jgi:Protein of unknown function (DUF669)